MIPTPQFIEEFLPFYFGCPIQFTDEKRYRGHKLSVNILLVHHHTSYNLLLRPMKTMTEKEGFTVLCYNHRNHDVVYVGHDSMRMYYRLKYSGRVSARKNEFFPVTPLTPQSTIYLCQQGIDVFGLIEAGLVKVNKKFKVK